MDEKKFYIYDGTRQHLTSNLVFDEKFDHLEVLVVDGHEESRSTQRIHTVDVNAARVSGVQQHPVS